VHSQTKSNALMESRLQRNGRAAGESPGRNSGVYAPKESDGGIIPMNHSDESFTLFATLEVK